MNQLLQNNTNVKAKLSKPMLQDRGAYRSFLHSLLLCSKHPSIEMLTLQSQHLCLYNCVGNRI